MPTGRFQLKVDDLGGKLATQGLLLPMTDNRFRIVLNEQLDVEAQRFVLCHEIAHSFYYWRTANKRPQRCLPFNRSNEPEERFCDAFAAQVSGPPPRSLIEMCSKWA